MTSAVFSPCRQWRYVLRRDTGVLGARGTVLFVGLNPSTADEQKDDPTVRRCLGYARTWGYAELVMCNVFALRSTDPAVLLTHPDPVGRYNEMHLAEQARHADLVVAAWGAHPAVQLPARTRTQVTRSDYMLWLLRYDRRGTGVHVLGLTKQGLPQHPLYLPKDRTPVRLHSA